MNLKTLVTTNVQKLLSDKDERNLLINIALAFAVKGLALLVSFFSMPMYIKYFDNDEVLGLWYTILSMLSWVHICDLGLGNGLRNRLTEALAVGDTEQAKRYISSTYAALAAVIGPVILAILVLVQMVDLNTFFNIDPALISPGTLRLSISLLLCGVAISFVLRTVTVIIYAIQKSSVNNILSLISSILPLLFIAVFRGGSMEGNLIALTVVHILAANLPMLVATVLVFRTKTLRPVTPSLHFCTVKTAKSMLNFGLQFFLAQIFFMVLNSTNEVFITRMFSASDVVYYSIYNRLFTLVGSLFMLALTPLWSKVTKDLAQQKYKKIQTTNRVLYALSVLAVVAEILMVICMQFIVNIWLGDEAITVSYITGLIFALYGSVFIFNVVLTTVANGMGDLRTQILFYGIFAVLKIPAIYLLAQRFANWNVVILYNGIALLVFCVFQLIWIEKRINALLQKTPSTTKTHKRLRRKIRKA